MSITDLPAYAVAFFGAAFCAAALMAPWLGRATGMRVPDAAERALMVMLGLCLLALWAMWRWLL